MTTIAEFPIGDTLREGTYRVERHLQGRGLKQLFLGRHRDGAELLITIDKSNAGDVAAFRRTVDYEAGGVFKFEFVGDFDPADDERRRSEQRERWALIERASAGCWLPSILGTHDPGVVFESSPRILPSHDPRTALQTSLALGRSAGTLLSTAASQGVLLTRVRPEYMWASHTGATLEVSGLSARADAFLAKARVDAVLLPLFDRYYYAPETQGHDEVDDRALVFSLAIMIAEWATGRFPYASKFHQNGPLTGKHEPLEVPPPLARLLARAMRIDRADRPRLDAFLAELPAASRYAV